MPLVPSYEHKCSPAHATALEIRKLKVDFIVDKMIWLVSVDLICFWHAEEMTLLQPPPGSGLDSPCGCQCSGGS